MSDGDADSPDRFVSSVTPPFPGPDHFQLVAEALLQGNVVPFLGAGVNLWGRDEQMAPDASAARLPSGRELAGQLAPPGWPREDLDLLRVSQYVDIMQGQGPLYQKLRRVFNRDYPVTPLHSLLARLPHLSAGVASEGDPLPAPFVVTTNYDNVLELAFVEAGQEFEQIIYIADGPDAGLFSHRKWRKGNAQARPEPGIPTTIRIPSEYNDADLRAWRRPVVLKIHGAVDTTSPSGDSYVITEDNYIDYLARTDTSSFLPAVISTRLQNSHILFLAYSLRDWNLRVVLRRIWGLRRRTWISWAVQLHCDELDRRFWARHNVELIEARLEPYEAELEKVIESMANGGSRR
jgi:SIR2-like protein